MLLLLSAKLSPLLFALVVCLFTKQCQSQSTVYCGESFTSTLGDATLYTRNRGQQYYTSGMTCTMKTTFYNRYMITLLDADVDSRFYPKLEIRKSSSYGELIESFDYSTSSTYLSNNGQFSYYGVIYFRFTTSFSLSSSYRKGYTFSISGYSSNTCPKGWYSDTSGTCYTAPYAGVNSNIRVPSVNYEKAQKYCNRMRSNLLIPSYRYSTIISLKSFLNQNGLLTTDSWIGLTDAAKQFTYRWLDGTSFSSTSYIRCYSTSSRTSCRSYERCAYMAYSSSRYVVMHDCDRTLSNFLCSMPLGGTDSFYKLPYSASSTVLSVFQITAIIFGVIFVVGGIIMFIYMVNKHPTSFGRRPTAGISSTQVVVGQRTVVNSGTGYPTGQIAYPTASGTAPYPTQQYYPQGNAPPAYSEVVGTTGGQVNAGYGSGAIKY